MTQDDVGTTITNHAVGDKKNAVAKAAKGEPQTNLDEIAADGRACNPLDGDIAVNSQTASSTNLSGPGWGNEIEIGTGISTDRDRSKGFVRTDEGTQISRAKSARRRRGLDRRVHFLKHLSLMGSEREVVRDRDRSRG